MPKDFNEFSKNDTNYSAFEHAKESVDPNLITNSAVEKEIFAKQQALNDITIIASSITSIILAPLNTIRISLQLSVLPHANKYGDVTEMHNNQLTNIPKELTVQDKRRYELLIKSGVTGTNKPFRAPVYNSYSEVFRGLINQGVLGLYKGNFLGLVHLWLNSSFKYSLIMNDFQRFNYYHEGSPLIQGIAAGIAFTAIDIITHPIELLQSRFILQNRLPNFQIYKSMAHFVKRKYKKPTTFMLGWTGQVARNFLCTYWFIEYFKENNIRGFLTSNFLSSTIVYPITTITRRLQCQDSDPGMLPTRYAGIRHGLLLMFQEEGIRGLYRGFGAFTVSQMLKGIILSRLVPIGESLYDRQYDN